MKLTHVGMDCAPTQTLEVSSESFDEGEEEAEKPAEPWGRLFPLGKAFVAQGGLTCGGFVL